MVRRIKLPFKAKKPIIACGADMKGAFAFASGGEVILYEGFGDLAEPGNLAKFENSIRSFIKDKGATPDVVACDMHPGYFSTSFAESIGSRRLCGVQHHEAHIASAITEHRITGDVIGVAFDGTGFGRDGNIWGGEFFTGSVSDFRRAARFEYAAMPGADAAVREPWRMAASYMAGAYGEAKWPVDVPAAKKQVDVIKLMIKKKINSPLTSSAGRLFDAVGSLILRIGCVNKEAELPMAMEKLCSSDERGSYKFDIAKEGGVLIIKTLPIIKGIVKDIQKRCGRPKIASKFHNTIAKVIVDIAERLSKSTKTKRVVLSGGVFQNKYLSKRAVEGLGNRGLMPYCHIIVPTSDSGIPIGQIAIANAGKLCV